MLTAEVAAELAGRLEGGRVRRTGGNGFEHCVEGRRGGVATRTTLKYGNEITGWRVEASVAKVPVLAEMSRRSHGDAGAVARGAVAAVPLGGEMDREWLLEGAPADTAKWLFGGLAGADLSEFDVVFTIDTGSLIIAPPSSKIVGLDVDELERAVDLVVTLANRIAELARERRTTGGARRAADEAEIARLRKLRDRVWHRASWPARIVLVLAGALLAAALLTGTYYGLGLNIVVEELVK